MADSQLKQKIKQVLRKSYFGDDDDAVYVSDSDELEDYIHVVVVSPKLEGKRLGEKTDLISSLLMSHLEPDEWGQVTLSIGLSPEELKAF